MEEKPKLPKSNFARYLSDSRICDIAATMNPSPRGELEITDLNRRYLAIDGLAVEQLGRGFAWFDTGTQESLLGAANFVEQVELPQGLKIACPEEVAYLAGLISEDRVRECARALWFECRWRLPHELR